MSLFTISVTPNTDSEVIPSDASALQLKAARRREILSDLGAYFDSVASGVRQGTIDIQKSGTSALAAAAGGTIAFTSMSAGNVLAVNGVYFIAVSGTPIRSNGEFKVGVSNTADAADFATTFNASIAAPVAGFLVASASNGTVTIAPSTTLAPVVSGGITNAVTIETIGILATATLTPVTAVATNTVLINGQTFTAEQQMGRQTATVSGGNTGDTVTVNGVLFTCVASGAVGNQFNKGGSDTITCANLAAAINSSTSAGVFGLITATSSTTTLKLRATTSGTGPNSYTLTATAGWTATGATFTNGKATSNNKFDYGDTNDQTVLEICRAVAASTTALVFQHAFCTPVHSVTISSGSGVETIWVNGNAVSVTWATSDTATATAMVTALMAVPAIAAVCVATSASGVITLAPLAGQTLNLAATGTGVTFSSLVNVYALYPGVSGNCIQLSTTGGTITASAARLAGGTIAQNEGAQASGIITISSGSGTMTATINGVAVTAVWATSDNNTAGLLAAAINSSTNALVRGLVTATSSTNTVTVTATYGGTSGMSQTLAASGTGCTVTTAWAGGAVPTQAVLGAMVVPQSFPGARLTGGVNAAANVL